MLYNKVFSQRELRKSAPYPFFDDKSLLIKIATTINMRYNTFFSKMSGKLKPFGFLPVLIVRKEK